MTLQQVSKERFDSFNPLRKRPADNALTEEVAWFEDIQADVIGVILENKQRENFAAVSFASSDGRRYQAYDLTITIPSFSEAKNHLREIMQTGSA